MRKGFVTILAVMMVLVTMSAFWMLTMTITTRTTKTSLDGYEMIQDHYNVRAGLERELAKLQEELVDVSDKIKFTYVETTTPYEELNYTYTTTADTGKVTIKCGTYKWIFNVNEDGTLTREGDTP